MKISLKILFVISFLIFIGSSIYVKSANVFVKFRQKTVLKIDKKNDKNIFQSSGNNDRKINALLQKYDAISVTPTFTIKNKLFDNHYTIKFTNKKDALSFLKELKDIQEVKYAELEPEYEMFYTPNDLNPDQWSLFKIDAQSAWEFGKGNKSIVVAVVDDAVLTSHEDLAANIWVNSGEIAGNGIDDDGNGYIDDINGWDAADNDNNPNPPSFASTSEFSHGTHCAGIVSAVSDNGIGVASMGNNISIMPVKTKLDATTGKSLTAVLQGVQYAVSAKADVISMSWGGAGFSQTMQDLFEYAHNQGIVLIAAAGNDNSEQNFYPSAYNHIISVGATDRNDRKASFSNYGTPVDVMAPGVGILSTVPGSDKYASFSGTSMACPLVAALAGYMKSLNPVLEPDDIEFCLKNTADDIYSLNSGYEGKLGAGRINAFNAVVCAKPGPPLANFTSDYSTVCALQRITFTDKSKGTEVTSRQWQFPGGIPANSTDENPEVYYSSNGTYDVIFISCNQYGCDTVIKKAFINIQPPTAKLSISGVDELCEGGHTLVQIELTGTPPWKLEWTDGSSTYTTDINDTLYYLEVYPKKGSPVSLVSVKDKFQCEGKVSGEAEFTLINCSGTPPRNDAIWYFGLYAGLDFSTGKPVPIVNSAMSTYEGCATFCDRRGNLLFYTDGIRVWNKEHKMMPNGTDLMGNESSSQSALVVPDPGNRDLYYIFTADITAETVPSNGLRYSIVDITKDGGNGDVTIKNIPLVGKSAEKVTGCRHKNGTDAWILTKTWGDNKVYAFLLTKDGVVETVISQIGDVFSGGDPAYSPAHGYMTISPDMSKLAIGWGFKHSFELMDFDNETGKCSNSHTYQYMPGYVYGLEFSPDNSKLYVATHVSREIYQFDISSNDSATISSSRTLIKNSLKFFDAMQTGPDGKIYVAMSVINEPSPYVGVINNPNAAGLACDFVEDGVHLAGKFVFAGLPNILKDYYYKGVDAGENDTICPFYSTQLNAELDKPAENCKYFWAPEEGLNNSKIKNPVASPLKTTNYIVTVITPDGDLFTDSVLVFVKENCCESGIPPVADFKIPEIICIGEIIGIENLSHYGQGASFDWQFGENAVPQMSTDVLPENVYFTKEGEYEVRLIVLDSCGTDTSFSKMTVFPKPLANAGPDITICYIENQYQKLGVEPVADYEYIWSPGEFLDDSTFANPSIIKPYTGKFILKVTSPVTGCVSYDTVEVDFKQNLVAKVTADTVICDGEIVQLLAEGGDFYEWSPSEGLNAANIPNPAANPSVSTKYRVVVSKEGHCNDTAYVNITVKPKYLVTSYFTNNKAEYNPGDTARITIHIKNTNYVPGNFLKRYLMKLEFPKGDLIYVENSLSPINEPADWIFTTNHKKYGNIVDISAEGSTDYGDELTFRADFEIMFAPGLIDSILLKLHLDFVEQNEYCVEYDDKNSTDILRTSNTCVRDLREVLISRFAFKLGKVTPNPVSDNAVKLNYSVGFDTHTKIEIFNSIGQKVYQLVDGFRSSGEYSETVPSNKFGAGLYFYTMTSGPFMETKSFVIE